MSNTEKQKALSLLVTERLNDLDASGHQNNLLLALMNVACIPDEDFITTGRLSRADVLFEIFDQMKFWKELQEWREAA